MTERLSPGLQLDDELKIVRALGRGAMGEVWLGEHRRWGQVAVKFLAQAFQSDHAAVQRFEREWMMAADIDSPHIVRMLDMSRTARGRPYIVMELLDGETLQDILDKRERLEPEEAIGMLVQVAQALDAAHARGIVHRDVKPENILFGEVDGAPGIKVLDFGLAKPWGGGQTLTATGMVMGTPYYMSPEQVSGGGRDIDHRADLWALAAVVYRMLSGKYPFRALELHGLVFEILEGNYRPISEAGGPPELDPWFARAFRIPKDERFHSAGEMIGELTALLGAPTARRIDDTVAAAITLIDPEPMTEAVPDLSTTQIMLDRRDEAADAPEIAVTLLDDTHTQPYAMGGLDTPLPESVTAVRALQASRAHHPRSSAPQHATLIDELSQDEPAPATQLLGRSTGGDDVATVERAKPVEPAEPAEPESSSRLWILAAAASLGVVVALVVVGLRDNATSGSVTAVSSAVSSVVPSAVSSVVPSAVSSAAPSAHVAAVAPTASVARAAASAVVGEARLSVRCQPACIVVMDRRKIGVSPLVEHPIEAGKHRVTAYRDDVGGRNIDIDVAPGGHEQIEVHMYR